MSYKSDIIKRAVEHAQSCHEDDGVQLKSAVRRCAAKIIIDLSEVVEASCHTDDELLDLAISAAGEYASTTDRAGVYDRVLQGLDHAGCGRHRAYHILTRLASELDSMLIRNDLSKEA